MSSTIQMPGRCSRDAPRFDRWKIKRFLAEFESQCKGARLREEDYCQHVTKYCSEEAEEFIESLEAYGTGNWTGVQDKLLEFYPSDEGEYMNVFLESFP
jgi:hypothetical protein